MPPQTIGRYTVLRELGHGAMGVVYEAEDPNIGRTVALKVVRTDQIGANREEVIRRFKNEARAAGNLSHPNIITIHDAGEHEGMLFIAMECVQGQNLADSMAKQGRMPADKVVDIVRQVCAGLDFAHKRGIVHRDIKPANILLADSLVKISDFGIANVGDGMTITGTVVGTPNYMSPEQVLGKPLDGRSDLFSVGVMLYEMVTGERPFEGQSITTIMYKIVHEEPIAPRKLDSSIHPGLSAVVERALAKSPEARFQTGGELAAALENYKQVAAAPGTASAASPTLGSMPTADLAPLPSTASLGGMPAYSPPTQPGTPPTIAQPATTQQSGAPEETKKRGFATTMAMGCFGVIIAGILCITLIVLVATWRQKDKKPKANSTTAEQTSSDTNEAPAQEKVTPPQVTEVSPPKPSKSKATLKLDSDPPGADVLVDGKKLGKSTPTTVSISRGQHTIALSMPGMQPASAKFKVSGGEEFEFSPELSPAGVRVNVPPVVIPNVPGVDLSNLNQLIQMDRNGGLSQHQKARIQAWQEWGELQKKQQPAIMFSSQPDGAKILVDGKDTGKVTPAVVATEEGKHTVRLELNGYKPYEKTLRVSVGIPSAVGVPLQSQSQPPSSPAPPTPPR